MRSGTTRAFHFSGRRHAVPGEKRKESEELASQTIDRLDEQPARMHACFIFFVDACAGRADKTRALIKHEQVLYFSVFDLGDDAGR
jgi:hypothetical protein